VEKWRDREMLIKKLWDIVLLSFQFNIRRK